MKIEYVLWVILFVWAVTVIIGYFRLNSKVDKAIAPRASHEEIEGYLTMNRKIVRVIVGTVALVFISSLASSYTNSVWWMCGGLLVLASSMSWAWWCVKRYYNSVK